MSRKRLTLLYRFCSALAALASTSGVINEREAFMNLVEKEIERLQSTLGNKGTGMVFTRGQLAVDRSRIEEALGQRRLEDKVTGILKRVERDLDIAETKIGNKFRLLDVDNDGVVSNVTQSHPVGLFCKYQILRFRVLFYFADIHRRTSSGFDIFKGATWRRRSCISFEAIACGRRG
jgi:hypothetical protein